MFRLPRLRQAVLAAHDLDRVAGALQTQLRLGEPFADPGVEHFGLRNAVFALGDTFLEVVSPLRSDTAAGRHLERRGGDCGYMVMFQVDDVTAARRRAGALGVREALEVSLEDMSEVHLHPADMRGAIVSLSSPNPPASWRWGGPQWRARSAPLTIAGARIEVTSPPVVRARWSEVIGELSGVEFTADDSEAGLSEVLLAGERREPTEIGGVRFTFISGEEGDLPASGSVR